jgi:tetratricopeptide (TPR) repeat protein
MALDKNAITKEAQKYASKGQYDKAIAEWKKLLKESPKDPNIFNTIGDLCLKKDAKPEAVDAYKRAADLLAEDGFSSKAIALYKKVINIDPHKIEVHLTLGDLNAEKGLTGNALESYKIVADHYQKTKEMAKALGIYQKMADLNPSNVAFRTKLADMYLKEGMKKEAAQAYLAAATVHVGGNKFNEARQLFEKVLA